MTFLSQTRHYFVRIKQSYFPGKLTEQEKDFIKDHLQADFIDLFFKQAICDQRHGLLVYSKCKDLNLASISDEELLLASTMHDIAKSQSFNSVTLRIMTALLLGVLPINIVNRFANSKYKFFNKIAIYSDHSSLSADIIKQYNESRFVFEATKYHHSPYTEIEESCQYPKEVIMFIEADTL